MTAPASDARAHADLRRAGIATVQAWNQYFASPSVENHRQLKDAVERLGKACT